MNKCKYLVMVFLLSLFTNISFVRADCTNEEIAKLKDEASKIKVTYEHLGEVTNDIGDVFYDRFNVEITNVGNDIILEINDLGYETRCNGIDRSRSDRHGDSPSHGLWKENSCGR